MNLFNTLLIQPLANGLIVFYRLLGGSMGLAIIGYSLFLRMVLNPLTKPYLDSMKKLKQLAPQLDKLKKKYKDDNVKLAQAQADFYKEKGVKPGAGCLPYLVQIVILIAFFNVFSRTLSSDGVLKDNFNKLLYEPVKFQASEEVNKEFLYLDLTRPDIINFPGVNFNFPGPVLFLAALVQLVSTKLIASQSAVEKVMVKKTPEASDDITVAMQKSMVYTFPFFTLVIGRRFASALALYWLVFSMTQVIQQAGVKGLVNFLSWRKEDIANLK